MTFGGKPMAPPPLRPRPPARGDTAFAVGSRALITPGATPGAAGHHDVQLLDEDGMPTLKRLPANASVVITAWRPRRSAPPRYRVCTPDQVEGWIDAANLRRPPPPPPPPPSVFPAAPQNVATKPAAPSKAKATAKVASKPVPKPVPKPMPSAARGHTARPPSPTTARSHQTQSKPAAAKPKRSRPAPKKRAR